MITALYGILFTKRFIALTLFVAFALAPAVVLQAQGTPADSGKWPWKLPFEINLSASFEAHFEIDTILNDVTRSESTYVALDNSGFEFDVDSVTSDSMSGNRITLNFDTTYGTSEYTFNQHLSITFDSAYDSIITLLCSFDELDNYTWGGSQSGSSFTFSGLRFDSSSIIYPYTTLSNLQFSYGSDAGTVVGGAGNSLNVQIHEYSLQTLDVSLGGIFLPTNITVPAAVSNSNQTSKISFQSYPNPFSQSTTISFTPETSGYADVSIVNLLGSEVAHLYSGELAAGEHSFLWSNPTGLPDGTYECLVRMNGQVQTLSMALMR